MDALPTTRTERLLDFFEQAEALCRESEQMTAAIDDLQSDIWMDLVSLRDQMHRLDEVQQALRLLASSYHSKEFPPDVVADP